MNTGPSISTIRRPRKSIFLQENDIDSYEKLDVLAEKATDHFHVLSDEIKTCEARLKEIGNLKKAITDYSKTRGTYEAYRKAGYSKKFFEEHRKEITIHKAAKKIFDTLPSKQIPKVKELSAEYAQVLERKKATYKEYRYVKKEMQQYTIAQKNVEMLLGRDRDSVPERAAITRRVMIKGIRGASPTSDMRQVPRVTIRRLGAGGSTRHRLPVCSELDHVRLMSFR